MLGWHQARKRPAVHIWMPVPQCLREGNRPGGPGIGHPTTDPGPPARGSKEPGQSTHPSPSQPQSLLTRLHFFLGLLSPGPGWLQDLHVAGTKVQPPGQEGCIQQGCGKALGPLQGGKTDLVQDVLPGSKGRNSSPLEHLYPGVRK